MTGAGTERAPVDAIIVGAMKAGSTTLASRLGAHPRVCMSSIKEPRYFSLEERASRGRGWYDSLFAHETPGQLRMEASTCYTRFPHYGDVMGRIVEAAPEVRLVYILRHPVERAYSHYGHEMRREVTMTFAEAIETMPEMHDASNYKLQIETILRRFDRERLKVVLLDDLRADEGAVLRDVCGFLGVDPDRLDARGTVDNAAGRVASKNAAVRATRKLGSTLPVRLVKTVLPRSLRDAARERVVAAVAGGRLGQRSREVHLAELSPMTEEQRAGLAERYRGSTSWVESFLGRSLPGWYR